MSGRPWSGSGHPRSGSGRPWSGFGARGAVLAPVERFGAPVERFRAPVERFGAPAERFGAPAERFGAPVERFGAPVERFGHPWSGSGRPWSCRRPRSARDHGPPCPGSTARSRLRSSGTPVLRWIVEIVLRRIVDLRAANGAANPVCLSPSWEGGINGIEKEGFRLDHVGRHADRGVPVAGREGQGPGRRVRREAR
ncbi:uncharacterized protein SOCEGT47_006090 [Sorangium cellulosum]|uniref:Uncharacterized protein n=1 Tax=Sorangium cellulosum TaxID=56 RepID=A0A4P2PTT6_SORCE|nr:uncharacterized protein SOCEGT47_006090 [Sorangium cellulosum]